MNEWVFQEDVINLLKDKHNIHIYQFTDEGDGFWIYIENKNKNTCQKIKLDISNEDVSNEVLRKAIYLGIKEI